MVRGASASNALKVLRHRTRMSRSFEMLYTRCLSTLLGTTWCGDTGRHDGRAAASVADEMGESAPSAAIRFSLGAKPRCWASLLPHHVYTERQQPQGQKHDRLWLSWSTAVFASHALRKPRFLCSYCCIFTPLLRQTDLDSS